MPTVLFATIPEMGHLNASFKLAKTLKSRGQRVCYLAAPEYAEYVRAQGLEALTLGGEGGTPGLSLALMELLLDARARARPVEPPLAEVLKALEAGVAAALDRLRPDLAVVDLYAPDVLRVAHRKGVPCVIFNTTLFNPLEQAEDFTRLVASAALPELVLCPKEFDFPHNTSHDPRRFYVEPSVDLERAEAPFPWERLDAARPLVYCSLGSQSFKGAREAYAVVARAVRDRSDWQVVLTVGDDLLSDELSELPPHVVLVPRAPQLAMLRRASVMITHGGLNGVKEAIIFGVPLVVVLLEGGREADQPMNAARVVYHGLGVKADTRRLSAETVASLVERVLADPSFKERVAAMGKKFREAEDACRGVRIVEMLLARAAARRPRHSRPAAN